MAISFVNSQGGSFNGTSCNVDTSGLQIGDICYVLVDKQSVNVSVGAPAGWIFLLDNGNKLQNVFAKPMAVGGDITPTNTFTVPNGRFAMLAMAFRGGNSTTNILSTYQGGIQGASHVPVVDWFALTNVPTGGSIFIGWAHVFDASGNFIGVTAPLPAGYTDCGVGPLSYGLGTPNSVRLFYQLNVSGTVDPPDTAPGGGFNNDFGFTAGSFDFIVNQGAANMPGVGDLSTPGTVTTLAEGAVTMPGVGDLQASGTSPLCQFPYIAYDYAGAFFCIDNFGNFVVPTGSNVQDICISTC